MASKIAKSFKCCVKWARICSVFFELYQLYYACVIINMLAEKHISAEIGSPDLCVYSLIVKSGDCQAKSPISSRFF